MSQKILIIGYYGCGNAGDQWLLKKTIRLLREVFPAAKLCALYHPKEIPNKAQPFEASTVLGELTYLNRWSPWAILKTITRSTHVVVGGGGVFQDQTSRASFWYYAALIFIAKLLRKKIALLSQGIGPLRGRGSRWLFKHLVKNVPLITLRDEASARILEAVAPQIAPIITADLVYFDSYIQQERRHNKVPVLGLTLINRLPQNLLEKIADVLETLPQDFVMIISDQQQDLRIFPEEWDINKKIIHRLALREESEDYSVQGVITMRYHVGVWASLNTIPFLALSDDPKLTALATTLGQVVIDINNPDELDQIEASILSWKENLDRYEQALAQKLPPLINSVNQAVHYLKAL